MTVEIIPLDAPLGARARGVDLTRPPDEATRDALQAAVDEHLLVLFRNPEPPTNRQVAEFCRAFGPLRPTLADRSRLPDQPEINRVSNRDADGVAGTGGHGLVRWHSDLSFQPPLIEMLWLDALAVTHRGGTTKWTNLVAAYEALDEATRELIDDLGVRYRLRDGLDFSGYFKASEPERLVDRTEVSLVQRNPRTGRRAVWPNTGPDFAVEVLGLEREEGDALMRRLHEHCTQDRFVYEHHWSVGDAFLWLNTQTMHQREPFDDAEERVMRHVNILGAADPRQLAAT